MIRDGIVGSAIQWLNTPYHHQARIKNNGVDCAQLIAAVAVDISGNSINTPVYSPEWHLHNKEEQLLGILESFGCKQKPIEERIYGDIITFKFGRVDSHLGIMLPGNEFIHARLDVGKVVINQLSGDWLRRLSRCYNFPNII